MSRIRSVCILVVLSMGMAACSSDDKAGESTTPAPSQELVVGLTTDQSVVAGATANLGVGLNIAEPLLTLSPDYEVKPLLAERWEFRAPRTWRFFLRRGVTFQDGQPFNAQAVKTGLFERVAKFRGGGTIQAGPESAVVVDDHTIDFTPIGSTPNLRIPEQIVHPNNSVYAPGSEIGVKPVGTGPFRFVEYTAKDHLTVERNPTYWGVQPKLDRITFRYLPDDSARRLALEAEKGGVDLIVDAPRADVKGLKSKDFQVATSPVGAYEAMYANIHGGPGYNLLSDLPVRKAVAQAIDRRSLVEGLLEGQATQDATFVPPGVLGQHASLVKALPFDPAAARAGLEAAGWKAGAGGIREKAGRPLKLTLVSGFPSTAVHQPIPQFIRDQLKQVGIELVVVDRADATSYQALITSGEGDLFLEQGNQNDANPGFLPFLLFSSGGAGDVDYAKLFAPGGRFDQLIAPTLTEVDSDKVRRAAAEAVHELVGVQAVVHPLAGIFRIYAMKKTVQGFVPHASVINARWDGISIVAAR